MYATLDYNTNWSLQNVLDDVIAVATGETNVNNLTPVLSKSTSSIDTSTTGVAGWTMHDDVDASTKILRAQITDDATRFKYIRIRIVNSTYIAMDFYKDWDNVAHTGNRYLRYRNQSYQCTEGSPGHDNVIFHPSTTSTNETFTVCLSVSQAHFMSCHTQENDSKLGKIAFMSEHERDSLWDTVDIQVDPVIFANYGISWNPMFTSFNTTRINNYVDWPQDWTFTKPEAVAGNLVKRSITSAPTTWQGGHGVALKFGRNDYYGMSGTFIDNAGVVDNNTKVLGASGSNIQFQTPFFELGIHPIYRSSEPSFKDYVNIMEPSRLSTKCGLYLTNITNPGFNDIVVHNGTTYRVWPMIDGAYSHTGTIRPGWCFLVKQ